MGLKNKRKKSYKQETEFVAYLQEAGFAAEKIRDQEGRRDDTVEGGDVSIPLCSGDYPVECKHHKDGFQKLYDALENAPAALIKQNHKRFSIIAWRLDDWLALVKRYESYRAPPISDAAE